MGFLDQIFDRVRDDPEAAQLLQAWLVAMAKLKEAEASVEEAERVLRLLLEQSDKAKAETRSEPQSEIPDEKEPIPATTDDKTKRPKTIGKRAFDLIVAADGALVTTSELAKTLELTDIQVAQGLRDYSKQGLLAKPHYGVWAWTGGSKFNQNGHMPSEVLIGEIRSGSFQEKMLEWIVKQGKSFDTETIAEAFGHPVVATKATLQILRSKGFVERAGKRLWRATSGVTKESTK